MKVLAVYWLLGCALVGFALGDLKRECPNEETTGVETAAIVAVWPVAAFAVLVGPHPWPHSECKK